MNVISYGALEEEAKQRIAARDPNGLATGCSRIAAWMSYMDRRQGFLWNGDCSLEYRKHRNIPKNATIT
jgi:hypothetical protein